MPEPDLLGMLHHVALGTVADVAPLTGLNRAFVAKGLIAMRRRDHVGHTALMDVSRLNGPPEAWHLGFHAGPAHQCWRAHRPRDLGCGCCWRAMCRKRRGSPPSSTVLNSERRVFEARSEANASASACASAACSMTRRSLLRRSSSAAIAPLPTHRPPAAAAPRDRAADAPASIDARAQHEAEMPGFRRTVEPRHIHQRGMADVVAAAHRNQALCNERTIKPRQRRDIGHGAECYVVQHAEQIRLRHFRRPESAGAQFSVHGDTTVTSTRPDRRRDDRGPKGRPAGSAFTSASTSGSSSPD